jgi:hypothetical protein
VRRQAGKIFVTPIREIYDSCRLNPFLRGLIGRLQNVQSITIEQEGVVPKQFVQLRNHGMTIGNGLGFELVDGSFDLCGSQFHRSVLSIGSFVLHRQRRESRIACPATSGDQTPADISRTEPHARIFERASKPGN